jgi:predicted ArsR family transcriptional regulator
MIVLTFFHLRIAFSPVKIPGWRRRLFDSTRGRILGLLRVETQTVNELAAALNLTDNAVRSHLTSLERDGFVRQIGERPGFRKPHVLYGLTDEAEHLYPKAYGQMLNHVLTVFTDRLTPQELQTSLREVGRTAAQEHLEQVTGKSRDQRIEFALGVLKAIGGDAVVQVSEGKQYIQGNGCPLSEVTAHHPEACLIAEALLSRIIDVPVKEFCHHGKAPRCCFEISYQVFE